MKRLLYALFILIFAVNSWAATHYLRADGTAADKETATSQDSASTSMSITTHNGETFVAGDILQLSDQGGVFRDTLTPPSDGASGNVITYEPVSGESPIISTADINTSWALQSQETGYAVYRGGPGSGTDKYSGARDTGATERNPRNWEGAGTTWANYTVDRMFHGHDSAGYYYIRTDGTAQDPGSVEIGTRKNAILLSSRDYITIQNIELQGPQGRATAEVIKDCGLIDFLNSTYCILDGCTLKYGIGEAVRFSGSGTNNCTVTGCTIDQCWGGIYGYLGTGSDHVVLIEKTEIKNTSTTIDSEGDRFCIGVFRTRGITITKCYIHDHGYTGMPGTVMDNAVTLAGGWDIEVSYNLIKSVAKGGISWGMDTTDTASNILIMYNIVDDFAKYPVDAANDMHSGIAIKSYSGATVDNVRIYGNTILNANDPGADLVTGGSHSALFISGIGQTNTNFYWSNNIVDDVVNGHMEYALWVNWGSCTGSGAENNCFYGSGDTIEAFGTAKTVAEFNTDHAWATGNIATTPDLDANYHLGASSTCDNAGDDLGATYDDGLDEDTTWSPLSVVTADQDDFGAGWDIGAFIDGTESEGEASTIGVILQFFGFF